MAVKRDKILREAEKLVQKGRTEQAIKEYEKLLRLNPNDPNTINRIGDLYGRIGKVEKAVELYERIAQHFTEDGFVTKAIAILKKINRIAPDRLDIFEQLADLYLQQGLLVEAKGQLQMVADWYIKSSDAPNAIRVLERIAQVDPDNHIAQLRLADLLLQGGEHERATEVYDRLGTMLLAHDRLDEAERLYRHVLEANPPSGEVFLPICRALLEAGRVNPAREFIEAAAQRCEGNPEIQAYRIQLLASSGDRKEAIRASEEALRTSPDSVELRAAAGKALLAVGEGQRAKEILLPLMDSFRAAGSVEEANGLIRGLLQALPGDREVLERSVQLFELIGDAETKLTLKAALADACYRSGDAAQATALYGELVELAPDRPVFKERLEQLRGGAGGAPSAEAEPSSVDVEPGAPDIEGVVEAAGSERAESDPLERLAEANVFAKYGLVDKAIQHLQDLVTEVPDLPEAREKLVALLVERGDVDGAREIAGPLEGHYRKEGQVRELKVLRSVLGQMDEEAPAEEPEDEVLVIEFDGEEEVAVEPPAEPEPPVQEAPVAVEESQPLAAEAPEESGEHVVELEIEEPPAPVVEEAPEEPVVTMAESVAEEPPEEPAAVAAEAMVEDHEPLALEQEEVEESGSTSVVAEDVQAEDVVEAEAEIDSPSVEESRTGSAPVTIPDLDDLERSLRQGGSERVKPSRQSGLGSKGVDELLGTIGLDVGSGAVTPPKQAERAAPAATREEAPAGTAEPPTVAPEPVEEELVEISDEVVGPSVRDLEQLDFFVSQELYDDALRMLERLEMEFPGDAELESRRSELQTKGLLLGPEAAVAGEEADELFAEEEEFIDLAKELEEELEAEDLMVEEATGHGQDEALLEEVFREFQRGVAEQLSEEDSDTHFNLGIAYKEMGLLPEAIGEFQIAAKNPAYHVESSSMIGLCYMEQGLAEDAAEWYRRALSFDQITDDARLGVLYDLGSALEQAGNVAEAAEAFHEILEASPAYRDAAERLQHLDSLRQAN